MSMCLIPQIIMWFLNKPEIGINVINMPDLVIFVVLVKIFSTEQSDKQHQNLPGLVYESFL